MFWEISFKILSVNATILQDKLLPLQKSGNASGEDWQGLGHSQAVPVANTSAENRQHHKHPAISCWTKTFWPVFKVCSRKNTKWEKVMLQYYSPWVCFSFSFSIWKALRAGHGSQIPLVDLKWKTFSMSIIHLELLAHFWNYTSPGWLFTVQVDKQHCGVGYYLHTRIWTCSIHSRIISWSSGFK